MCNRQGINVDLYMESCFLKLHPIGKQFNEMLNTFSLSCIIAGVHKEMGYAQKYTFQKK